MATKRVRKYKDIAKDLEDITVYNFYKCLEGELEYLFYNYKKQEINEYVQKRWKKLYNKYCELTKNNTAIRIYLLASELLRFETKFKVAPILLSRLEQTLNENILLEYVDELKKWDIYINIEQPLKKEIEKAIQLLKNNQRRYNRLLDEYKELTKDKGEGLGIYEQKAKLERILTGARINIKEVNVIEWLAYWKEVEEITSKKQPVNGE